MRFSFLLFIFVLAIQTTTAQSEKHQLSFTPGLFYNGNFLREDVPGIGLLFVGYSTLNFQSKIEKYKNLWDMTKKYPIKALILW